MIETTARIEQGPLNFGIRVGEEVPSAKNWAFIASRSRTGSNFLAHLLSLHPDCWIGREYGGPWALISLFSSDHYFVDGIDGLSVRAPWSRDGWRFSAADARLLCEAWRQIVGHGKAIVGDKQRHLWFHREAVRRVFPGCHIVTTIRHPLHQLESACRVNPIIAGWNDTQKLDYMFGHCQSFAQALAEKDVTAVRYEDLCMGEGRVRVVQDLWRRFGLVCDEEGAQQVQSACYDRVLDHQAVLDDPHVAGALQAGGDARVEEELAACGYRLDRPEAVDGGSVPEVAGGYVALAIADRTPYGPAFARGRIVWRDHPCSK